MKKKKLNQLLEEFKEIEDIFISMETGNEYTNNAIDKMNNRMTEIALEITYDLLNERY